LTEPHLYCRTRFFFRHTFQERQGVALQAATYIPSKPHLLSTQQVTNRDKNIILPLMAAYHSITARRRQSSRGFTLIELLVVIAIIGLLASVIIASLGSARAKGRDARRLADLRSMANQIELQRTGVTSYAFVGCTGADVRASTCTTPGLQAYKDPSGVTTACTSASTASCDYSVSQAGGLN